MKHVLRARYYIRYMDDWVILEGSKSTLWSYLREITGFLQDRLHLRLNRKTAIFPVARGIDFLGYRIWDDHRLLRKSSIKRAKRGFKKLSNDYAAGLIELDKVRASVVSWLGHCRHADTYRITRKVLGGLVLTPNKNGYGD
ncbi:MAG: hypothetical protein GX162_06065 [Firmicutes bacterium]|nr:hypothetical protein [Bacillota bacterium]